MEPLTIIGAGPVGSLLATHLARRGCDVTLYERRADMRSSNVSAGRSINLAISARGLHALASIGLERKVLDMAIPMRGRRIHTRTGETSLQPYGRNDSECIYSISRGELNKLLLNEAESTGRVKIHFHQRLTGLDRARQELQLMREDSGETSVVPFERAIGSDGSASCVRDALAAELGYQCSQNLLDYGYKELVLPAGPAGCFAMDKNALHIWPRGHFMLIALPNLDGSFTCTLFLPFKGNPSFETLKSDDDLVTFVSKEFPDALPLLPNLKTEFFGHPTGQMVTVKCSPWNAGDKILLLGDAAHAIVPFFGQGMNCGFEDVTYLGRFLDETANDWEKAFQRFSLVRKQDADAIADMAVENFIEMRDKVADPTFLKMKELEKQIQKMFPSEYVSRYSLVTFSRIPYHLAQEAGRIEETILHELLAEWERSGEIAKDQAEQMIRQRLSPVLNGLNNRNHSVPSP